MHHRRLAAAVVAVVAAVGGLLVSEAPLAGAQTPPIGEGPYYVTFVKRACDDYTDIDANQNRNNIQQSLRDLGADSPYDPFVQVEPSVEQSGTQASCAPVPGWTFSIGDGIGGIVDNLSTVTNPDGTAVTQPSVPLRGPDGQPIGTQTIAGATTVALSGAQVARAFAPGNQLWVQEGTTTDPLNDAQFPGQYGFGALRCAIDNLNGDNVEWVKFPVGVRHVFCFAFDVTPPPGAGTIIIETTVAGAPPGTTQTFPYTGTVSYNPGGTFELTWPTPNSQTFIRGEGPGWTAAQFTPPGYVLAGIGCASSGGSTFTYTATSAGIDLAEGDTVTCTFANRWVDPSPGQLRLRKTTAGGFGGPFYVTVEGQGVGVDATTTYDGQTVPAGEYTLPAGVYDVQEDITPNPGVVWGDDPTVQCNGETITATGGIFSVEVAAGEAVDCLITNFGTPDAAISIDKVTQGGVGTFEYTIDAIGDAGDESDSSRNQSATTTAEGVAVTATGDELDELPFGTYVITEIAPPESDAGSWTLADVVCEDTPYRVRTPVATTRTPPDPIGVEVTLDADSPSIDCTFTNVFTPTPPVVRPTARFVALTPARILDTRQINQVGYDGPKPGAGDTIDFQVTGEGGVPATGNIMAVVMTVTATEPTGTGYVTVYPTGEDRPLVSNLNSRPEPSAPEGEQAVPNLVTVPLGAGGQVSIYTQAGTDLIADVAGFYEEVTTSAEGRLVPVGDPVRVLDTRPESGPLGYSGPKPAAGQTVTFQVAGIDGVPATGAASVVMNVTATEASARGFVTAFPGGETLPWASNLNLEYEGQTVPDQVIVPLGADGTVSLYTQSGAHLIADVAGWFTGPTAPQSISGLFRAISPERHLDTRGPGTSPVPAGATVTVPVDTTIAGPSVIPETGVGAVVANVTATEAVDRGFITAFPSGSTLPWASNLNVERPGQDIPNHVTVGVGEGEDFDLYTQSGTHLIADLFGYYLA